MNKSTPFVAAVLCALVSILVMGCRMPGDTPAQQYEQIQARFPVYRVDELRKIQAYPDPHTDRLVAFHGRVFDSTFTPKDGNTLHVFVEDGFATETLVFRFRTNSPMNVYKDDPVRVLGRPMPRKEGVTHLGSLTIGLWIEGVAYAGPRGSAYLVSEKETYERWKGGGGLQ